MKVTICGSMSFAEEMVMLKDKLVAKGHEVTIPTEIHRHIEGKEIDNKQEKIDLDVIRNYFHKIKDTDALVILNKEKNGVRGYIGGNSLIEMAFAYVLNKKIFLTDEIPEMQYTDEIEAMNPIILEKDFKNLE